MAIFRGAGEAFAAGADIREFLSFTSAEDGIAYEERIDAVVAQIEKLPVPTIAVVQGVAMGVGLLIAAACDFRIAPPAARFGVPIARTLGNCLSISNTARLVAALDLDFPNAYCCSAIRSLLKKRSAVASFCTYPSQRISRK